MSRFSHCFFNRIDALDASLWHAFFGSNPFTSHAFLSALEQSCCVTKASGWEPQHLAVYENDQIIALAPGYLKYHSYGEYVFDWAWADAYRQHGLDYYPKWLCASPFSPIEGRRLAIEHPQPEQVYDYIATVLTRTCQEQNWSGWHINFCREDQAESLRKHQAMMRLGVQFQWFNQGYRCFDDFLERFSSRRRKVVKKERRKIIDQGIDIKWIQGADLTPELMAVFYQFYQRTYAKRSGHLGYLNAAFFQALIRLMPQKLLLMLALKEEQVIAATLSFVEGDALYGRYWGANAEYDCLHFELCYYQGIEYCIQHQLTCFHSGAQGEHKIARGFEPVFTWSAHDIIHPDFKSAIAEYLMDERQHIMRYHQQCQHLLPFKNSSAASE